MHPDTGPKSAFAAISPARVSGQICGGTFSPLTCSFEYHLFGKGANRAPAELSPSSFRDLC